jgi:DNA-binding LytR/AlgR family response regulator
MSAKIYIVEDEPLIAETIKTVLLKEGYVVCGVTDNAKEALYDIEEFNPDLILLDITIEGDIDGVSLATKIQQKFKIPFVFLTSLSDPETIDRVKKTNPYGYIIKPFNEAGLRSNIELALHKHQQEYANEITSTNSSFFIKNKGELIKIVKDEVLFIEAFDNYAYLKTKDKKHILSYTLKKVQEKLNDHRFLRIHRSYVINTHKIDSLVDNYVIIQNHKLPVGKSYKEELMNTIALL